MALLPEEAELVRRIFDRFLATGSLTAVETELLHDHVKTKTGKNFTRFAIKNILKNPVYMLADEDAYQYFTDKQTEVFSERTDFNSVHGILAYNRTDQEKGRAAIALPVNEWIVSVGQHPGLISGRDWIRVQESLDRNKTKAYRKPRSNKSLLTGLIFCRCGSRMYPKLTKRLNADGEPLYSYVCKMKERSQRSRCNLRNANGNLLDAEILAQIKELGEDDSIFVEQLEKGRKLFMGSRDGYETKLNELQKERAENERKITGLVDSLAELPDGAARSRVAERIEELNRAGEELNARIAEWEGLSEQHRLSDMEFDLMRQMLTSFRSSLDAMDLEQKRAAVRALVHKVVWDGECAHVVLFGAEDEIEFSESFLPLAGESGDEEGRDSELPPLLGEDSK